MNLFPRSNRRKTVQFLHKCFCCSPMNAIKSEVALRKSWNDPRLSPHINPVSYNLLLHPDLKTGSFTGKVTINVLVKSVQHHVSVHIKGLNITQSKVILDNDNQTEINLNDSFEYEKNEFWIMVPQDKLQPETYKLYFEFEGKLTNKIVGFYRSIYKNASDEERYIATTKFEPTFARQAFPCFDEPNFKAKYDISLVKPSESEYIALSNMPVKNEEPNKPVIGLTTVNFLTTFAMSTYLVCFIVCDFSHEKSVQAEQGFPITVYARKEHVEEVKYAQNVALISANYYIKYFNIEYPLPKLDLIAIPDFISGAMENWGLITFRETRLLCSENSSVSTQLGVALTVAHEIAHMWFGDLVTMKWWDDLWLNEGFATFVEFKAAAQIHPDWELDNIFLLNELYIALQLDRTLSSHPIIQPVSHPDQITEIFDTISYSKGASILRMLEATVGENHFRQGVTSYMKRFKFENTETQYLWNHLDAVSAEVNVTEFMDTWTRQMGFPLISVSVNNLTVTFTQKRFLIDPEAVFSENESPFKYRWEIPITFVTSNSPTNVQRVWIKKSHACVTYELSQKIDWIKVNYHNMGYYIVNYEHSMWNKLNEIIEKNFKIFDPADRANILFDAFNLAESGILPYEEALRLTRYLPHEDHYVPWSVANSQFLLLNRRLYDTDAHPLFVKCVNSLINDTKVLHWAIDGTGNYLEKSFQNTILNLGCVVGNKVCLNQTIRLFSQWLSVPEMNLNSEHVAIILYYGIEQSGETEWESLWKLYLKEENPQLKIRMMNALCATKETKLIKRYLQLGKNETYVRSQDYLALISAAARNPIGTFIVWDFVRNEWDYLVKRYTLNDRNLGNLIPEITLSFATESRFDQMKEFFVRYPNAGAGAAARKRALERVENNIKWRYRFLQRITDWLKNTTRNL